MSELIALGNQFHQGLPDRKSPPAANSGHDHAWMMHMERAQFADWFRSSPPAEIAAPALAPTPLPIVTIGQPTLPLTEISLHQTAYHAPALQPAIDHVAPTPSPDAHRVMPTTHQSDAPDVSAGVVEFPAEVRPELTKALHRVLAGAALSLATGMNDAAELQKLSIHLEPQADGVTVAAWIGANTHDQIATANLAALRDALMRSLQEKGLRLGALTINGRLVWQASIRQDNN